VNSAGLQWKTFDHPVCSIIECRKQIGGLEHDNERWDERGSDQHLVNITTAINDLLSPDAVQIQAGDTNGDLQKPKSNV
jgi:hypothetical protein